VEAAWHAATATGGSLTDLPIVRQESSSSSFSIKQGRPLFIPDPISRAAATSKESTARFTVTLVAGEPLPLNQYLLAARLFQIYGGTISISIATGEPGWAAVCALEAYSITAAGSTSRRSSEPQVNIEFASQLAAASLSVGAPIIISGARTAVQLRPVADRANIRLTYAVAQRVSAAAAVKPGNLLLQLQLLQSSMKSGYERMLSSAANRPSRKSSAADSAAAAAAAMEKAAQFDLQLQAPDRVYCLSELAVDTVSQVVHTGRGSTLAELGEAAADVFEHGGVIVWSLPTAQQALLPAVHGGVIVRLTWRSSSLALW
jgi:hypothetical protein